MWVFALILGLPLIEIVLFVTVGAWLGLWLTLAIVVGTAVFGIWLLRQQGARAQTDLRAALQSRQNPARLLAGDLMTALAAILLILPGFLTDTLGLLLLLPPVQHWISATVARRTRDRFGPQHEARTWDAAGSMGTRRYRPDEAIDATWEELPPDEGRPPSGRTRH